MFLLHVCAILPTVTRKQPLNNFIRNTHHTTQYKNILRQWANHAITTTNTAVTCMSRRSSLALSTTDCTYTVGLHSILYTLLSYSNITAVIRRLLHGTYDNIKITIMQLLHGCNVITSASGMRCLWHQYMSCCRTNIWWNLGKWLQNATFTLYTIDNILQ